MHGAGKMIYRNQGRYIGEFSKGKRHGQGSFEYLDGRVYEGNWSDDKENGAAKFTEKGQSKFTLWKAGQLVKQISIA